MQKQRSFSGGNVVKASGRGGGTANDNRPKDLIEWEEKIKTASTSDAVHPYAHLPIVDVPDLDPSMLRQQNPYEPFDSHVVFYENVPDDVRLPRGMKRDHLYFVNNMPYRGSCTGFLGEYFGHFDGKAAAEKIVGSWKWNHDPTYRYYQKTAAELETEWGQANKLGSRLHMCIELFFNGLEQTSHPDFKTKEFDYHFRKFYGECVKDKLRPWRTEWIVFDRLYELVGSIDMVFKRVDSDNPYSLILYDWKRCLKIESQAYQDESATGPFEGLPKATFWKYSLQLNTYKFIIERNTPYRVEEMVLVRFHPDSDSYERLVVPDLQEYVRRAAELRWRNIMQLDLDLLASTLLQQRENKVAERGEEEEAEEEGKEKEKGEEEGHVAPVDVVSLMTQVRRRFEDHCAQIASGAQQAPTLSAPPPPPPQQRAEETKERKETYCSKCSSLIRDDDGREKTEKEQDNEPLYNRLVSSSAVEQAQQAIDPRLTYVFETSKPPPARKNFPPAMQTSASSTTTSETAAASATTTRYGGRGNWFAGGGSKKRRYNGNNDNEEDDGDEDNGVDPRLGYVW